MRSLPTLLEKLYLALVIVVGVVWIIDIPQRLGLSLVDAEWIGVLLGIGIAAALLKFPYLPRRRWLDVLLGFAAIGCWTWMSMSYNAWIVDVTGFTAEKFIPGAVAIVLLVEAMRKAAGRAIAILVWLLLAYALLGHLLPPPLEAERMSVPSLIMYLYADTNGVPGEVMTIIGTLVLAFIVLGRLMDASGAMQFFTGLALAAMGSRRGGPAKVAVAASSVFGTINGSAIANVMSTGMVTIPLMKRTGFKAEVAAAIEAVASNGGQLAPPVMGATAFLIAEFLQVSYAEVAIAALLPAILYYLCLFLQVDAIAVRHGLTGMPQHELPRLSPLFKTGWPFLLPLALLVYLLFWRGYRPALAALAAALGVLVLATIANRRLPSVQQAADMTVGAGESMLPLLMIGGGAGIVIGVMNITGLGFSLSLMLIQVGADAGLFVMLLLTAAISIVLGTGMPTTAIYVVLSIVLAPALLEMGIAPMAAHLFIFYFGLLSVLTPPVAIASFVAARLAGSDMWSTSWHAMRLGAVAYVLPFLWCYNAAFILEGTTLEIAYAVVTALVGTFILARALQQDPTRSAGGAMRSMGFVTAAVLVGGSTIWFGGDAAVNLGLAIGGIVLLVAARTSRAQQRKTMGEMS